MHSEYVILIAFGGNNGYVNGPQCYIYTCIACHFGFCFKTGNPLYLTFLYLYARVMMTDLCLSGSSPQQQQSKEQLWVEIQEHKEELAVKEGCLQETARDLANLRYV